jgi:holliday junction DNA helicase RuvA
VIDYVNGIVQESNGNIIILDINGFGMALQVPKAVNISKDKQIKLYTYLHWNSEQGPSIFGFKTALERQVFLMIITCSKIGPSIALAVLSHFSASQFLEIITTQNENRLSSVSGIGVKKAEQMIVQLKHKVQKFISSGEIIGEEQTNFIQWQNVADVLTSLNYSKTEVSRAMHHITEKYGSQNYPLDQLIRTALSYLSANN